jgi:hypothetical protein
MKKGKPVLVTTSDRGVFFGYLKGEASRERVTITQARNCVYWVAQLRGFVGLAVTGPIPGCKIGPAAIEQTLYGSDKKPITSVTICTPEAVEAWESAPWS